MLCLHYTISDNEQTYFIKATADSPCAAHSCFTLSNFINNTAKDVKTGMILQFGAGNHTLNSRCNFSNIEKCSMSSKDSNNTIIICDKLGAGFTFNNVSMVTLINIIFIGCGNDSRFYAVLQLSQVNINISACTFLHSKGRAIEAAHANITTQNCTFEKSTAGVIIAENDTAMYDTGSIYTHNTFSMDLSALLFFSSSTANYTTSTFHENFATVKEKFDMIRVTSGKVAIIACELAHNNGTMLLTSTNSTIKIFNSMLTHNFILHSYSLIQVSTTNILIDYSTLAYNVADKRGTILHVRRSTVESCHTLTIVNNTSPFSYAIMDIRESEVKFGEIDYSNNTGTIFLEHSKANFTEQSKFQNHKQVKGPYSYGGAITSIASIIRFQGTTSFCKNYAILKGGAIYATQSRLYTNGDTLFSNNKAGQSGGALYLDQSDFVCQKKCTFTGNAASKGGAIHAISSIFTMGSDWNKFGRNKDIKSSLFFASNSADKGGAVYLEANSKFRAPRGENCTYEMEFDNNVAIFGGAAVFVNDYTNVCNHSMCFIQASSTYASRNNQIRINSTAGNTTIYGGLLDRCTVERRYSGNDLRPTTIGFNYINKLTKNVNINNMMTSDPVRVCHCTDTRELNCSYTEKIKNVKRGETFNVSVAAVDQANHTVDSLIYVTSTKRYMYRLAIGQWVQVTHNGCTDLKLKVSSLNDSVKLILYPEGPCQDIGVSKAVLHVNFQPCTCPIGFQQQKKQEDCVCDCDQKIKALIKMCNSSSSFLLRQGDFWINYVNDTDQIDYLIYPHCPYDYCVLSTSTVSINLNIPNGADAQCASNRTGLLCSSCKPGLSLSLGSSRCLKCPNDWQKLFIVITMGAIASGIALVVMILVLNLTTAVGTLNGLIFYANIVASNNITYNHMTKPSVFSVFIAWLNLELGLDTCFYNGLDSYSKAWLQFIFPAYLIVLLIMVILMSKYSSRFAKLIGKRNPIATLTTVILLSYMKLLRNTKDIFSVAVLRYPDGLQKRWLPDANIKYLYDKHIPLFLVAVTIITIGVIYTVLLLTWQWLLQAPHHKYLGWIRNTRLNLFMEANLAAYNTKHRYWSGLLLLIRVALYFEIALDTTNRRSNNLLAAGIICTCLLFIKALSGTRVYKNNLIDYFNSICYVNLLILSIIYHSNRDERMIVAKISVSIAFLQLLCVFTYHTIITLLEIPCLDKLKLAFAKLLNKHSKLGKILPFDYQETNIMMNAMMTHTTPTSTEIGLQDSIDASAADHEITEQKVEQSLTTGWEETDSLREPLLQELKA